MPLVLFPPFLLVGCFPKILTSGAQLLDLLPNSLQVFAQPQVLLLRSTELSLGLLERLLCNLELLLKLFSQLRFSLALPFLRLDAEELEVSLNLEAQRT